MVAQMDSKESPNKKMQQQVDLTVTLPSSTPIVGKEFKPEVVLHGAPHHFLQFQWYRLLNDKQVNCHLHKFEKALVQCKPCVRLNLPIEKSYFCSAKCYYDTWKHHRECHSEKTSDDDQNQEDYTYDLQNLPVGSGNTIVLDQACKFWLNVDSLQTYVPSKDDFGCILRLNTLVVDCQLVLKENVIFTDRVIKVPPTYPRIMIGIEPPVGSNSKAVRTKFRVLSYNILADMHVPKTGEYKYCPTQSLKWDYRRENLVHEIIAYDADILCLQEVQLDHFENYLKSEIEKHGYSVTYKGREPKGYTSEGQKAYGCATFYRVHKFRKIREYELEFGKCAHTLLDGLQPSQKEIGRKRLLKDNVAILTVLQLVNTAKTAPDMYNSNICVVNTHICASEQLKDVKLWQVATLIKEVEKLIGLHLPVLLCGDLNSRRESAPYHLVVHGEVDHNHPEFPDDPIGIFKQKLSHILSLVSAYSKMNLGIGKPQFTHFSRNLKGTLDYIFYQEGRLVLKGLLELLQLNNPLPSTQWSSDHVALVADFEFA